MKAPSTQWSEQVEADEAARFEAQGAKLKAVHAAKSARFGKGRLLHRKAVLAAKGSFEVLDGLPAAAKQGIFARPGRYDALVRFSNGGMDVQDNAKPDIRGAALKVLGVSGPACLGGTASSQDFLLINHPSFSVRRSDEFVDTVVASSRGLGPLFWHLVKSNGFFGAISRLKAVSAALGKPFTGFAGEPVYSAVPIRVGPYAAKVRLSPVSPSPRGDQDPAEHLRSKLSAGPVVYELALQFFVDETLTPIEDPTVVWPESESPYVTVGRLTLTAVEADVESLKFDPWGGLEDHRPLGEIMRARKAAYYVSQQGRGVA